MLFSGSDSSPASPLRFRVVFPLQRHQSLPLSTLGANLLSTPASYPVAVLNTPMKATQGRKGLFSSKFQVPDHRSEDFKAAGRSLKQLVMGQPQSGADKDKLLLALRLWSPGSPASGWRQCEWEGLSSCQGDVLQMCLTANQIATIPG